MKRSILLPSLAVLSLLSGCSRHSASDSEATHLSPVPVHATTVRTETLPVLIELTGSVYPVQRAQIAAKVMGSIAELPVALGQPVRAGDLLVKISAGEISARVLQAQSQLNQARRDLDRERDLLTKGASTTDTVKSMEDRFAMTQALLRESEVMLDYTILRAPFDGVVTRKLVNAGDLATPGLPLLEIEGVGMFEIELGIPDTLATGLAVGTPLSATVPATGVTFSAPIRELSPAADAQARAISTKLTVPPGTPVRSGQFVRVQVPGTPARLVLVPANAVSRFGQMERVFTIRESRAELRLVKTGSLRGDQVEILSGLSDGDRIITEPSATLRDGQPVEVLP